MPSLEILPFQKALAIIESPTLNGDSPAPEIGIVGVPASTSDFVYNELNVSYVFRNDDFRFCVKTITFFGLNVNNFCCDWLHSEINFAETVERLQMGRSERMQTTAN